jgi:hypothetical protein
VAEATGAPVAFLEILHDLEPGLHHRHKHHLCNPFAGLHGEGLGATVPA